MRWVYLVVLVIIVAIFVVFVVGNNEKVSVKLFHQNLTAPMSWFFVAVYLLGMWSGATVVRFLKRAYHHATEHESASQKR